MSDEHPLIIHPSSWTGTKYGVRDVANTHFLATADSLREAVIKACTFSADPWFWIHKSPEEGPYGRITRDGVIQRACEKHKYYGCPRCETK
jgi:hypothetical protein